jgi:peptidylprolyl isomerase
MLILTLLLACGHTGESQQAENARDAAPKHMGTTPTSAPSHTSVPSTPSDVSSLTAVTSPSGLSWYVLKEGTGPVAAIGDTVGVHYTGWLTDGSPPFDSSFKTGRPLTFTIGGGRIIKGWDEGVAGMKVGEKRQLHIPAALGYGARGMGGVIPPDANLVFDVELMSISGK